MIGYSQNKEKVKSMSIQYGDRVYIYIDDGRDYLLTIQEGKQFSTHRGNILLDEIAGKNYGEYVLTTKGNKVYLLPVGIIENIYHMRRSSQIIYPKDLGFILIMLDIKEGNRVIDVGLGSGSMTKETYRVLKDGGRLMVSDVVLVKELPEELKNDKDLLIGCVSGAILKEDYLNLLKEAGFSKITIHKEIPAFLPDYALSITFSAIK